MYVSLREEKVEIIYKTDLYASYMLVKIPNYVNTKQYSFRMVEQNRMKGILPCKQRMEDGESYFYLDITGKKSLVQEFADKEMELEDMIHLFQQFFPIFEEIRNYLLTEKMLLLEPEFLYRDIEDGTLFMALLPWERQEETNLHKLAEFFLEKVNHRDEYGVNAAYHFYRQQNQPQFSFYHFLPTLEKESIMKRQKKKDVIREEPFLYKIEQEEKKEKGETVCSNHWTATEIVSPPILITEENEYGKETKLSLWKKISFKINQMFKKEKAQKEIEYKQEEKDRNNILYSENLCEETVFFESTDSEHIWKLQWKEKGRLKTYELKNLPLTIGKLSGEVSIVLQDASVSRVHCRFVEKDGTIAIMDMNSTNGTCLNGMRLKQGEILEIAKNDEILIGQVRAVVV